MTSSSQEKTRNKLMDSMRKTKASATGKTEPAAATTKNVEKKKPQQSKRVVAKKPAKAATKKATKKPAKAATKKATKKAGKTAAGQYQAGRRVWPD